jgi:hypothetical protein
MEFSGGVLHVQPDVRFKKAEGASEWSECTRKNIDPPLYLRISTMPAIR